jgi:hypothetical protein
MSRVNDELKTKVSDISSASIVRVGVVNHQISLIFTPACKIDAF